MGGFPCVFIMKATLIYDATCALCSNYQKLVKRKLGDKIDYAPCDPNDKDFHYRATNGSLYSGTNAIDKLVAEYPEIKDLMFILPPSLRVAGIKAVYKVSGVVKKGMAKVKGCNCGKH